MKLAYSDVVVNATKEQLEKAAELTDHIASSSDPTIGTIGISAEYKNTRAGVESAVTSGSENVVAGHTAVVQGSRNVSVGSQSGVVGNDSIAIGRGAHANASSAIQIGAGTNSNSNTVKVKGTTVLNSNSKVPLDSLELEGQSGSSLLKAARLANVIADSTNGVESVGISSTYGNTRAGYNSKVNSGSNNVVNGSLAQVTGSENIVIGNSASATTSKSIAIGTNATYADAEGSIAIGRASRGSGANGISIGNGAFNTASKAIQLGEGINSIANTAQIFDTTILDANGKIPTASLQASNQNGKITLSSLDIESSNVPNKIDGEKIYYNDANGNIFVGNGARSGTGVPSDSIAIGNAATQGDYDVAIGDSTEVTQDYGIVIGSGASCDGTNGIAIGKDAVADEQNAVAIGANAVSRGANTAVILDTEIVNSNGKVPFESLENVQEYLNAGDGITIERNELDELYISAGVQNFWSLTNNPIDYNITLSTEATLPIYLVTGYQNKSTTYMCTADVSLSGWNGIAYKTLLSLSRGDVIRQTPISGETGVAERPRNYQYIVYGAKGTWQFTEKDILDNLYYGEQSMDMSPYKLAQTSDVNQKQNSLVAGSNVTLTDNQDGTTTISATGGGSGGTVDTAMSDSSANAVQNKVIKGYVDNKIDTEINAALADIVGGIV